MCLKLVRLEFKHLNLSMSETCDIGLQWTTATLTVRLEKCRWPSLCLFTAFSLKSRNSLDPKLLFMKDALPVSYVAQSSGKLKSL